MEILLWSFIIILFLLSFVGILYPIIPSVVVLWGGFILYHFTINADELSILFWVMMGLFTFVLMGADILANSYFVKKYGGSKWGNRVAGMSVITGSFIFPPFGILIIPFVAVFLTERMQKKSNKESLLAALGSLIGFLSGALAKVFIQVIMILWFFVEVFLFKIS